MTMIGKMTRSATDEAHDPAEADAAVPKHTGDRAVDGNRRAASPNATSTTSPASRSSPRSPPAPQWPARSTPAASSPVSTGSEDLAPLLPGRTQWARLGSNQRPEDYESDAERPARLRSRGVPGRAVHCV